MNAALTNTNTGSDTFSGKLTSTGALVKAGSGTLILSGAANDYSGATTVNGGTLAVSGNSAMGTTDAGTTVATNTTLDFQNVTYSTAEAVTNNGGTIAASTGSSTFAGGVTLGGNSTYNVGGTQLTQSGAITDGASTFGINKTGTGVLVLSGNNTYDGNTTISAGTVLAANNGALGASGAATVNAGARLQMSNGINVARAITLNGDGVSGSGSLQNVSGANTNSGTITLGSSSRVNTDSGTLTISGDINGGANVLYVGGASNTVVSGRVTNSAGATQDGTTTSVYKDGAGTLTLSGANTYTGDTRISAGNIAVGAGGNLGSGSDVFITTNGTLSVNADASVATIQEWASGNGGTASIGSGATLTVNGNATNFYMNSMSGAGGLTKSGTGTMNLYGTQGYTGTTTVSGGKLSSGVAMASTNVTVSGGTYETTADNVMADTAALTVNSGDLSIGGSDTVASLAGSGGNVGIASGKTLTVNETGANSYSGAITNAGGLTKIGAGTTTLSGANTYTGTTTIGGGTLALSGGSAIANAGVVTLSNVSGAALAVNASETIGSLRGGGATGGNVSVATDQILTVAETGSQTYSGAISGAGGFTKSGAGTTTLSANSSYSGATTVSAGTLAYNGNNSSTAVGINSGGTLSGSGSLGAVTVNSGGVIAPGNSPGTLSVSSLTLNGGGSYNWEVTNATGVAGTGWDVINVGSGSGAITLNATSGSQFTINIIGTSPTNFTASTSYSWDIIDAGSWSSGFASNAFAINTSSFSASGSIGTFTLEDSSGNLRLVYTAPVSDYTVSVTSGSANQGAATGGAGQFTGTSSLIKTGAGTLVMTNSANDYTGSTTVQAGTLQIDVNAQSGSAGALGNASSAVVVGDTTAAAAAGFNPADKVACTEAPIPDRAVTIGDKGDIQRLLSIAEMEAKQTKQNRVFLKQMSAVEL
jgi:autotransporter-associated beta strand protein